MKLTSVIHSRTGMAVVCAAAALSGLVAVRAHADGWDKRTILTVDSTIQVRETVLPPGKYVMKLYDSPSQRHVVQIFNEDQSHLINTVFAIPTQRMEPTGDTTFTFWETPAGHARALRAWYYPGDTIGNEFPYPKNPKLLAMASVTETSTRMDSDASARTDSTVAQSDAITQPDNLDSRPDEKSTAADATVATAVTESNEVKPVEETPVVADQSADQSAAQSTAQNNDASSTRATKSSELPRTGSFYPLIGLGGALMLAFAGLLKLTRTA